MPPAFLRPPTYPPFPSPAGQDPVTAFPSGQLEIRLKTTTKDCRSYLNWLNMRASFRSAVLAYHVTALETGPLGWMKCRIRVQLYRGLTNGADHGSEQHYRSSPMWKWLECESFSQYVENFVMASRWRMCVLVVEGGVVIPGMLRVKVHRSDYRKETTGRRKKNTERKQASICRLVFRPWKFSEILQVLWFSFKSDSELDSVSFLIRRSHYFILLLLQCKNKLHPQVKIF